MTLLLLDTTFLIDTERGATELDGLIGDDDDVATQAITLAELTVGVELARASDPSDKHSSKRSPTRSRSCRTTRALRCDTRTSGRRATGRSVSWCPRLIIAATAAAAGRTVVSADRRAFDGQPCVTALDNRSPSD